MEANQLASLRRRRFMTQTDLANRVGVSMKSVQSWEGGRAQPRLRHIPKLAEALGVDTEQLVGILEDVKTAA